MREFYERDDLRPVMPYDPDAFLSTRRKDAFDDGKRAAAIAEVASGWRLPPGSNAAFWDRKLEEVFWTVILLLFGTSKASRKPRLDFFVMHFNVRRVSLCRTLS